MTAMTRAMALINEEDGSAGVEIAMFTALSLMAGVGFVCFSAGQLQQAVTGSAATGRY